jgi:hypothetical protein
MSSKFTMTVIILTVLALGAAAFFQYKEMESFDLPRTLKERFFPEPQPAEAAPAEAAPAENAEAAPTENAEAPANP